MESLRDELGDDYEEEEPEVPEALEEDINKDVDEDDLKVAEKKDIVIEYATDADRKRLVLNRYIRAGLIARRKDQLTRIKKPLDQKPIPTDIIPILPELRFDTGTIIPPEILFKKYSIDEIINHELFERSMPIAIRVVMNNGNYKILELTDFRWDVTKRGDDYLLKRKDKHPGHSTTASAIKDFFDATNQNPLK